MTNSAVRTGNAHATAGRMGLWLAALWLLVVSWAAGANPSTVLFGRVFEDPAEIRLYWECRDWPDGLVGYSVALRVGPETDWQSLHEQPIRPAFDPKRDWANVGLDPARAAELLRVHAETFGMRIPDRSAEEVLALLVRSNGLKSGDRLAQKMDFNLALFGGFAFVDRSGSFRLTDDPIEYGLFAVDSAGNIADEPLSTWLARAIDADEALPTTPEFAAAEGIVRIAWSLPAGLVRDRGIVGFNVFREESVSAEWVQLNETPLGFLSSGDATSDWRFVDYKASSLLDHRYLLVAVDVFQQPSGRVEALFEADRYLPMAPVAIDSHALENDQHLRIRWKVNAADKARISRFVVERADARDMQFEEIGVAAEPMISEFLDTKEMVYGNLYSYRVVIVDRFNKRWPGAAYTVLYLGQSQPPTPTGLAGRFAVERGQPGVWLSWDLKSADDRLTHVYRILTDIIRPDDLLLQGDIESFTGNRYFYPIKISGGRDVTFGLQPQTEVGITGKPALAKVRIPTLKLPAVAGLSGQFDAGSYALNLNWRYPEDWRDLAGFRLSVDGQSVAGPEAIGPDAREFVYTSESMQRGQRLQIVLSAIGGMEDSDPSLPFEVIISVERPVKEVPAPLGFTVDYLPAGEENQNDSARLHWQALESDEPPEISGYALMVDYAQPGNVRRLNSLPPLSGTEFHYILPQNSQRESYIFRLAALTSDNRLGPYAEAILQVPTRQQP